MNSTPGSQGTKMLPLRVPDYGQSNNVPRDDVSVPLFLSILSDLTIAVNGPIPPNRSARANDATILHVLLSHNASNQYTTPMVIPLPSMAKLPWIARMMRYVHTTAGPSIVSSEVSMTLALFTEYCGTSLVFEFIPEK